MKLETIKNFSIIGCMIVMTAGSIHVAIRNEQREKRNKALREMPPPLPKGKIDGYKAFSLN